MLVLKLSGIQMFLYICFLYIHTCLPQKKFKNITHINLQTTFKRPQQKCGLEIPKKLQGNKKPVEGGF